MHLSPAPARGYNLGEVYPISEKIVEARLA